MTTIEKMYGVAFALVCAVFIAALCIGDYLYYDGFTQKHYRVKVLEKKAVCSFDRTNTLIECEQTKVLLQLVDFDRRYSPESNYFNHDTWMTLHPGLNLEIKINRSVEYHPALQLYACVSIFTTILFGMIAIVIAINFAISKLLRAKEK